MLFGIFRKATGVSCGLESLAFAVFWPVLSVHAEVIIYGCNDDVEGDVPHIIQTLVHMV